MVSNYISVEDLYDIAYDIFHDINSEEFDGELSSEIVEWIIEDYDFLEVFESFGEDEGKFADWVTDQIYGFAE